MEKQCITIKKLQELIKSKEWFHYQYHFFLEKEYEGYVVGYLKKESRLENSETIELLEGNPLRFGTDFYRYKLKRLKNSQISRNTTHDALEAELSIHKLNLDKYIKCCVNAN